MTYCLGFLLPAGLVLATHSRSNAGGDQAILDCALTRHSTLNEAAKLSLLSFDATMRSNLSADAPTDPLRYVADSFSARKFATLERDDPCWMKLRTRYADGLFSLFAKIPPSPQRG